MSDMNVCLTRREVESIANIVDKALNDRRLLEGFKVDSVEAMRSGMYKLESVMDATTAADDGGKDE